MLRQFKCYFHENDTFFARLDVVLDTWIFLEHLKGYYHDNDIPWDTFF